MSLPVLRRCFSVALLASLCLPLHASQTHKRPTAQKHSTKKTSHRTAHKLTPAQRARAARIKRAFVASSQLRPMAQQLIEARSPQAFSAVESYARAHRAESSGTMAWLVVGYAHLDTEWRWEYAGELELIHAAPGTGALPRASYW